MTSISAMPPVSISAISPAALQILKKTEEEKKLEEAEKEKPVDLVEIANGITEEVTQRTTEAFFAVNAAFFEMDEKNELIADAVKFIDSDQFKITDPLGKNLLKQLLSEQGWEFMQLVNQQYELHGGLSRESLFALTLPELVMKNRERFDSEEFEVGIKFEDVLGTEGIIVLIPDIEGNSTYRDYTEALEREKALAEKTGDLEVLNQLEAEFAKYKTLLNKAFDYNPDEAGATFIDIDDLAEAPWIPKPPPKLAQLPAEEAPQTIEPGVLPPQLATAAGGAI